MADLLSKFQAYGSSSEEEDNSQEQNSNKNPSTSIVQNGQNSQQSQFGNGVKAKEQYSLGINFQSKVSQQDSKVKDQTRIRSTGLLGKRSLISSLAIDKKQDSDIEDEDDLMSRAFKQISQKNIKEGIMMKQNKKQKEEKSIEELEFEEQRRKKLQNIDPYAQKLFSILPPPTNSTKLSISSALQSNAEINFIQRDSSDEDTKILKRGQKYNLDDANNNRDKEKKFIEVNRDELVNKDEFYRNQVKKHSILAFRDQTLQRMRGQIDTMDQLASKGKGKNHLASMASDHLDMITKFQDDKSSNLDEFRQKRARYGW
ncbi:UNKNOWN [Stylonychia lemnae]|uniref:Uncharacterized protein n=1 Tax=Stylonychia lemnae TaxID=5949 RepID=A0A078BC48_STYLE|nr:UNKNOWN [Stylonychia lemnae]|eukprot:CDW91173.1 UNKNOWN [Stylonychia lemnae]